MGLAITIVSFILLGCVGATLVAMSAKARRFREPELESDNRKDSNLRSDIRVLREVNDRLSKEKMELESRLYRIKQHARHIPDAKSSQEIDTASNVIIALASGHIITK